MTSRATTHRPLRCAAALGAGLLAATALTACAAGNDAQTAEEHAAIDGTIAHVGAIDVDDLSLSPPSGAAYPPGSNVAAHLVLINDGQQPDALIDVSSRAFRGWRVSGARTSSAGTAAARKTPPPVPLPAGEAVGFNEPDTGRTLTLVGLDRRLYPGTQIQLSFTFRRAGTVRAWVPVQLSSSQPTAMAPA